MLIIDERSEKKSAVISSMVKTFNLSGNHSRTASIDFDSYVVQLIECLDSASGIAKRSLAARKL